MENYASWETGELLTYLFELGEAKCNGTWISPIGEEKLNELENIKNAVIEEMKSRTVTPQ